MARRHPNYRLVKIHRSYTVEEVAKLFAIHRNTVRQWIKDGLRTCDNRRPILILGRHLVAFLVARRRRNKRTCEPGQLYCFRCREPRDAAGGFAEYSWIGPTMGNLSAICSVCDAVMNRRVNPAKLQEICGVLDVSVPVMPPRLAEMQQPCVNSDLRPRAADGASAQPQQRAHQTALSDVPQGSDRPQ